MKKRTVCIINQQVFVNSKVLSILGLFPLLQLGIISLNQLRSTSSSLLIGRLLWSIGTTERHLNSLVPSTILVLDLKRTNVSNAIRSIARKLLWLMLKVLSFIRRRPTNISSLFALSMSHMRRTTTVILGLITGIMGKTLMRQSYNY